MHVRVARDSAMVRAFSAASQAAVRMVHRNLVSTFDFGGKTDPPWMAREHLIGVSMIDVVSGLAAQRTKVPWVLAVYLVAEAAEGVAAVRSRLPPRGPAVGFLTGSAVPCVVVTDRGEVKIVDACLPLPEGGPVIDSRSLPYWPADSVAATASPGRCDVFGLGVVLWELIAGRRLFAGRDDDETIRLRGAMLVPTLRTASQAPPVVDEIVQRSLGKMLSHAPALADAAALARELRAALAAQGASAGPGDAARLVTEMFAGSLAEQRAALEEAWAQEQALQSNQDTAPDLTCDTDESTFDLKTMPERSIQTIVASVSSPPFEDEFDEAPTVSLNNAPGLAPSKGLVPRSLARPASATVARPVPVPYARPRSVPPGPPASVPPGRPGSVPPPRPPPVRRAEAPPPGASPAPPFVRPSPSDPATAPFDLVARPAMVRSTAERSLPVLPPVEVGPVFPQPIRPSPGSAVARVTGRSRPRSALVVAGVVGFVTTLIGIVAIGLFQRSALEADPTPPPPRAPPPTTSASAASSARPAASWVSTIPVLSPGDLPVAPSQPASPAPHGRTPPPPLPVPAGRTGRLTVVCTPACDDVFDGAQSLGPSPVFKLPVTVGVHRLRLHVEALPVDRVVNATVRENDTTVVRETLGE
jgi:serine/threonine-protein kinase